jgi:circadian clock protein KaiB
VDSKPLQGKPLSSTNQDCVVFLTTTCSLSEVTNRPSRGTYRTNRTLSLLISTICIVLFIIKPPTVKPLLVTIRNAKAALKVKWNLRLYVAGMTPKANIAIRNLERLCKEHLAAARYRIEIVDLSINPQLGQADQIVALPALVRNNPLPIRKLIGSLSDTGRVLAILDMGS